MEGCWNSVLKGSGDVKELIPEFFYMPEFLRNEVLKKKISMKITYFRMDSILEQNKLV